ncbi:MAG: hypothetical protein EOO61_07410 [Hymenobacter sp.]|nr:MAG: hypothetical protein EOO61_07410 [Hymenobacter sp.]
MKVFYKAFGRFATLLLCLLLQQCTRDLPNPAPAALKQTAPPNQFAAALTKGEVHLEYKKVAAPVLPSATTSRLAQPTCYDYYLAYYDNTGAVVSRDFLYSDCPNDTGNSGATGDGNGSSSGGGGSSTNPDANGLSPNTVLVIPPDIPVNNIRQFLKCFSTSQSATFTVYVRQPVQGTDDTWSLKGGVGHTFISITQNGITRVFGFYPTSRTAIINNSIGIFGDNSQTRYTISVTTTISGSQLNNLLQYTYNNENSTYDLDNYNCTDFGIGAAASVGVPLPDRFGIWVNGYGGGSNPGCLGYDLSTKPLPAGVQSGSAGISPLNSGGC